MTITEMESRFIYLIAVVCTLQQVQAVDQSVANNVIEQFKPILMDAQNKLDGFTSDVNQLINQTISSATSAIENFIPNVKQQTELAIQNAMNAGACIVANTKDIGKIQDETAANVLTCVQVSTKRINDTMVDLERQIQDSWGFVASIPGQVFNCVSHGIIADVGCFETFLKKIVSKVLTVGSIINQDLYDLPGHFVKVTETLPPCASATVSSGIKKLVALVTSFQSCVQNGSPATS